MSTSSVARFVATVGRLGEVLPAPGTTAGSLPAALAWWGLAVLVPDRGGLAVTTGIGVLLATALGLWASHLEAARRGLRDPGPVVIDEVAGQWLTFLVALPWAALGGRVPVTVAVGFLAFRMFDVIKPWPVRRLERLPGGTGIMADDLAAAVLAGLLVALIQATGVLGG